MLKKFKRCLTALIAAAVTAACTGCTTGKSTAYAMTIDGYELKAGVYIFYQNTALEEAKSEAMDENENLDTTDEDALKETKIDGKDFMQWVSDKTMEKCTQHVAVIKKFDELGLTLDESDVEGAKDYAASLSEDESDSNVYYLNGIGEESLAEIILNSYKSEAVFNSIYGEGGSEGVKNDDVKKYYIENNMRTKLVSIDLHDAEGSELDDAGKKEREQLANKLLGEVEGKSGKELLTAFDEIQTEYDEYIQAQTEEAAGDDGATTEVTTTTAATTTTTVAETTEAAEAGDAEEGETTDEQSEDTEAAEEEAVTTTTTAPEDTEAETTETTTTTNPYANETIIPVVTTEEGTKEEDVSYSPSKVVYDWAFDSATKAGVPEIIKDEDNNTIYIAVKLDIEERLTDDDLWTEENIERVRSSQFGDQFQEKVEEWAKAQKVEENKSAIDRYKPFGYKQPETTAAAAGAGY